MINKKIKNSSDSLDKKEEHKMMVMQNIANLSFDDGIEASIKMEFLKYQISLREKRLNSISGG